MFIGMEWKGCDDKALVGLLQPIEPPTQVWEDLSLDFVISLPAYNNNIVIIVTIDCFSKAEHFGMLPTNFTSSRVVEFSEWQSASSTVNAIVLYLIATRFS